MAKTKSQCSATTRTLLFALLAGTVLVGAFLLFKMPQIEEGFDQVADKKVLLIHAEWCGHCRTLLESGGVWEQLKSSLPGVQFQELEEGSAAEAVVKYGVAGFPDIRVIDTSGGSVARYDGPRDVASLKAFVMQNVGVVTTAV